MDILEYFDSQCTASLNIKDLTKSSSVHLIILLTDLLKLANEKLTDEINWILRCVQDDFKSFDYTMISKSVRKSLKQTYFDINDKQGVIDNVLNMLKPEIYNQFVIDKAIELLQIIIEQFLDQKCSKITVIFEGIYDLDLIFAQKRVNCINTWITEDLQHEYIKEMKKKKQYIKPEWNLANLTPCTQFMKSVYKQFVRSNLPFINCEYEILNHNTIGTNDQKLGNYLQQQSRNSVNTLILMRERQTLLRVVNIATQQSNIYVLLADIINFDEYKITVTNCGLLAQQIYKQTIILQNNPNKKINIQIQEVIAFIQLFRNSVIDLPIPTQQFSIPAIFALYYKIYYKKRKDIQSVIDFQGRINLSFIQELVRYLQLAVQFYDSYKGKKYSNLIYLYLIGAITPKYKIDTKVIQKHNFLFPDLHIMKSSSKQDYTHIYQYSDQFYLGPDITILNNNYRFIEGNKFPKYISQQIKMTIRKVIPVKFSNQFLCEQYMQQLQKIVYDLLGKYRYQKGLNTLSYQSYQIPPLDQLINYCQNAGNRAPLDISIIEQSQIQLNIKPFIMPLITNPSCRYEHDLLPLELQLNMKKIKKECPSLITDISILIQSYRQKKQQNLSHYYQLYTFQQRYAEFVLSNGQIAVFINNLVPLVNMIKYN